MTRIVKLNNGSIGVESSGRFQLTVKADPKKFRITNINGFVPYGQTADKRLSFKSESGDVEFLIIDKIKTMFYPDDKKIDDENVKIFIQHPNVYLEGMKEKDWDILVKKNLKKPDPDFILTNIDKVENIDFDEESNLIEAKYLLYNKTNPISKDRLLWLCTRFNLATRNKISDEERQRKYYVKILDNFIQSNDIQNQFDSNKTNIESFTSALENIKETEYLYYINNLIEIGIIIDYSGIFKLGDRPVGSSKKHVIEFYEKNSDVFIEHKKLVFQHLKNTQLD
jgi:hypothetical protein